MHLKYAASMNLSVFVLLTWLCQDEVFGRQQDGAADNNGLETPNADGYTDENRPYKFAFTVEGYQHRSEQKDDKGIIMGEFGFVTGDGVYHVTKYATDENGKFRILSMKSFYIGLPGEMMNMPLPTNPPTTTSRPTPKKIELTGIQGCSGCRIPTTNAPNKETAANRNTFGEPRSQTTVDLQPNYKFTSTSTSRPTKNQFIKNSNEKTLSMGLPSKSVSNVPAQNLLPGKLKIKNEMMELEKPELLADRSALLYEFNQTQTYQGHHEKGYVDSTKEGNYFVNQRDGIKQEVEYIANENGYQPYIRFVNLTASEIPDPETEKIRNMLQTMYFKWFYGKKQ